MAARTQHRQDPASARPAAATAESRRLGDTASGWKSWGPYVSERAWGTVREDYSERGDAWEFFPHDQARSRAYRWSEDGLGGICDDRQVLCLAFAFWNGRDPILKERIFGLTGTEGNHGEDPKEYWWYLDSTPTHSWMRWRYVYPQAAFPYDDLVVTNRRRGRLLPEYELVDTGIFDDDRYWEVTADYAKSAPDDLLVRLTLRNAGPDDATVDVLPTLWFRNRWSWDPRRERPTITAKDGALIADHDRLGRMVLVGEGSPELLFCENETNVARLWGGRGTTPYPKDGIGDHVVHGAPTVNPDGVGSKAALRYRVRVRAGGVTEIRLRLSPSGEEPGDGFAQTMTLREQEADEFYAALTPAGASADEAMVMRQAFAGMLWSKQFSHYDVGTWLEGDPGQPPPPVRRRRGRNAEWRHVLSHDIISMPDKWEYPWFAAWDLAFHCVALAHVDPAFAKEQLLLLCWEWYMHPSGQIPAYEWAFDDANPPVHAWAALRVFEVDGSRDYDFLERVFHKLLLNFTWWVNRKDVAGNNVFEGGFLGLDNIGPINRSAQLPVAGRLKQADATAWMAMYCLNLWEMALVLAEQDLTYEDMAGKFFEHFALIAAAIHEQGLWDEEDGFYYDVLEVQDGRRVPLRVRSMVGLLPLCATTTLGHRTLERLPVFAARFRWILENRPRLAASLANVHTFHGYEGRLMSVVDPARLRRILRVMLDENEFLSPHGLRSLARSHGEHPFEIRLGDFSAGDDYEPGESTTGLFGGNSNWRGPVWLPVNYLVIEALRRFARFFGDDFLVEHPTGSGHQRTLAEIADDLSHRLVSIFLDDERGRRPVFGHYDKFQEDPAWHDMIPFHEYFHGDSGMGIGAPHQTGWTGLVADLIVGREDPFCEAHRDPAASPPSPPGRPPRPPASDPREDER